MIGFLRHGLSLGLALAATWWLLFRAPAPSFGAEPPGGGATPSLSIETLMAAAEELVTPEAPAEEPATPVPVEEELPEPVETPVEPAPEDPAPEEAPRAAEDAGLVDGADEGELFERPEPEEAAPPGPDPEEVARAEAARAARARAEEVRALQEDEELLEVARSEVEGEVKRGFQTVFFSDPEDQLDIARAFGEQVVLVPRTALDPGAEAAGVRSYRLDLETGRVREIPGRPALERFRQYRDLLSYEYARLPEPLRELRMRIVRRDEIYVFAALVPASEWALAVGRRRAALARHGVSEEDVARFELRYVRLPGGAFDLTVDRVVLADGRVLPGAIPSR